MARNSEKAMAVLNRWTSVKTSIVKGVMGRRPRDASSVEILHDCEYWRSQVVREVTRKISEIQNAGLGEHRIRDLNDEINRLLREKGRWEDRIKELGGPDHKASAPRVLDAYGAPLTGEGSYKYFGAAKDLPGVRELFEKDSAAAAPRKTRAQLYRNITPDYYGWRDEEEGDVILAEQARETELHKEALETWQRECRRVVGGEDLEEILASSLEVAAVVSADTFVFGESSGADRGMTAVGSHAAGGSGTAAADKWNKNIVAAEGFVALPSTTDIEEMLVEKKKQALLAKYIESLDVDGGAADIPTRLEDVAAGGKERDENQMKEDDSNKKEEDDKEEDNTDNTKTSKA